MFGVKAINNPSLTPPQRVWVFLIPESCKLQNSSNPMFDANLIDAQHQAAFLVFPESSQPPAQGAPNNKAQGAPYHLVYRMT